MYLSYNLNNKGIKYGSITSTSDINDPNLIWDVDTTNHTISQKDIILDLATDNKIYYDMNSDETFKIRIDANGYTSYLVGANEGWTGIGFASLYKFVD